MNQERYERVKAVFQQALEADIADRPGVVAQACGDDADLLSEVQSLLEHVESPAIDLEDATTQIDALWKSVQSDVLKMTRPVDDRIGGYEIEGVLGEGGMGVVYLAEQERPHRKVALKVLRSGVTTPDMLRRFDYETEVLGRLHHAGIAQIFDAGVADTGHGQQPFFAMEYIDGRPLIEDANARRLDLRRRLELMAEIADAVHHAHQRGVIHRDLKPGNILIDSSGHPKVLDFGIARATDSDRQLTHGQTSVGQLIGTLPYMSPEQAAGNPDDLDIRSDVYALGVILYELISGRLPYELPENAVLDAIRVIREKDARPVRSVSRAIPMDVETILGKALAKEKDRRYDSAAALAADIRRFLSYEPIAARPPSAMYQVQRFAQRHTGLVVGMLAVVVALLAGVGGTSWGMYNATIQKGLTEDALEMEERQRNRAEAIRDFLNEDVIAQANPFVDPNPDLSIREALDAASERISERFADDPGVEAGVRAAVGEAYEHLGLYQRAEEEFGTALSVLNESRNPDQLDLLLAEYNYARICWRQTRLEESETRHIAALERATQLLGPDHEDTIEIEGSLGLLYYARGQYDQAEQTLKAVLERARAIHGPDHDKISPHLHNLGLVYRETGRYGEAEQAFKASRAIEAMTDQPPHPRLAISDNNIALAYQMQGRYDEAEELFKQVIADFTATIGEDHPHTLGAKNSLAAVYRMTGRLDDAEPIFLDVYESRLRVVGPDHVNTLVSMNSICLLYRDKGDYEEAIDWGRRVHQRGVDVLGADHPYTMTFLANLSLCLDAAERFDEAEPMMREVLAFRTEQYGPTAPHTLNTTHNLCVLLLDTDRPAEAQTMYEGILGEALASLPPEHTLRGRLQQGYGRAHMEQGRYDAAEAQLLEAIDHFASLGGDSDPKTRRTMEILVETYRRADRGDDADAWQARLDAATPVGE